jgi:hypothetical protein
MSPSGTKRTQKFVTDVRFYGRSCARCRHRANTVLGLLLTQSGNAQPTMLVIRNWSLMHGKSVLTGRLLVLDQLPFAGVTGLSLSPCCTYFALDLR